MKDTDRPDPQAQANTGQPELIERLNQAQSNKLPKDSVLNGENNSKAVSSDLPGQTDSIDDLIEKLTAARNAAINTAIDELPDEFENSKIAELANQLLDRYKDQAKAALNQLMLRESLEGSIEAIELLFWKYKEMNDQTVDMKFAEAYGIIKDEIQAQLVEAGGKSDG